MTQNDPKWSKMRASFGAKTVTFANIHKNEISGFKKCMLATTQVLNNKAQTTQADTYCELACF